MSKKGNGFIDRTGESRVMHCGLMATIIRYSNNRDMDVVFENGVTKKNVSYNNFKKGKVHPSDDYWTDLVDLNRDSRVGLVAKMCFNQECEIIEYHGSHDITVRFLSDGAVVKNKTYDEFVSGSIKNPNVVACDIDKKNDRLFDRRKMSSGKWATIIAYNKADDITVQFDDGVVVEHKTWVDFSKGHIRHPENARVYDGSERIGLVKEMNNGMLAKIVAYRSAMDIDVLFLDNEALVNNTSYLLFDRGAIANPEIKSTTMVSIQEFAISFYLRNFGFRKLGQGEWSDRGFGRMELDFYNDDLHIAIECDGGIHGKPGALERDEYKNLKCKELGVVLYRLRDPYLPILTDGNSTNYILNKSKRLEMRLIDCKEELESIFIAHHIPFNPTDIDFERDYNDIVSEYRATHINVDGQKHIGEVSYSPSSQQNMKLIAYHNADNVDVEFDDGTIKHGVTYHLFKIGGVLKPGVNRWDAFKARQASQRLHEKNVNNKSWDMEIIGYRSSKDVDVRFSDGSIRSNITYADFKYGKASHPDDTFGSIAQKRVGEKSRTNAGYEIEIINYRGANDIDVKFLIDGYIKVGVSYSSFKSGSIRRDNYAPKTDDCKKK